jgi:hypothetical protein
MIETIKTKVDNENYVILKKVNNLYVFILSYGNHAFTPTKFKKVIKKYFAHSYVIFYVKIMWRGKAYRVRFFKKNSKFTLNFGHSHWCKLMFNKDKINFFKLKRQSYLMFFYERLDYINLRDVLNNIRLLNKYTKRGIKLKKTPYIRRFGKISQVNSSLHSFN